MTEPISDASRADSARTVAEHLAARPDKLTELIRLTAEAGDARLHTVLASLAAVLEDRGTVLAEREQARTIARAAHVQAKGWHQHALEHRGDTGYTVMAHAMTCVLTTLEGGDGVTPPAWITTTETEAADAAATT